MLGVAALMLASAGSPAGRADPHPDAFEAYHALLAKQCPASHLEWLSEGELDDLIEVNFHDALPASLQSKLDAADETEKRACANVTMGLSCFNIAHIRAMDETNLLARFSRMACDSGMVCRAPADCGRS